MADEIEYDCSDCGRHIIAFGFYGFAEPGKRCASCDWIRGCPQEDQAELRERLGVPLVAAIRPDQNTLGTAPGPTLPRNPVPPCLKSLKS